jgi:quercetin dioxygenase-like cupin family protein
MKVAPISSHQQKPVDMTGAKGAKIRVLVGPDDGADKFHMRHFEIAPGGWTPHHEHDYEHELIILAGRGVARSPEGDRPVKALDIVFVPAGELHQFVNSSDEPLEMICLIPAPKQ